MYNYRKIMNECQPGFVAAKVQGINFSTGGVKSIIDRVVVLFGDWTDGTIGKTDALLHMNDLLLEMLDLEGMIDGSRFEGALSIIESRKREIERGT